MNAVIPARTIRTRRVRFGYDGAGPHDFMGGDPAMSHVIAVLSSFFPEGEDFFVRSVRNYRDQITDPVLKEQVKGFIGQEALHGREHRAFNQRLQELGYPTRFTDKRVKIGLGIFSKIAPKRVQLAFTAGLEHYTATLAEALLRDDAARAEFETDEIRTLFSWHALEETEHKSVAFDVFQHVCGDQNVRVRTMYGIHVGFLLGMVLQVGVSLAFDPYARRHPVKTLRSLRNLRSHVFFQRNVQQRLRDYHRADFHPDDHDTVELLDQWRQELGALQAA